MVKPPQDDSHLRTNGPEYAAMLRLQARELEDEAWDAPSEQERARVGRQADKLRARADKIENLGVIVLF